ncbi:MAG TPA: CbtA family protein [Burkholderiales bacterium]
MSLTGALPRGASLRGLLLPALAAGIAAGAVATVLQELFLIPLILQAETLEAAGQVGTAAAWEPQAGLERALYTLLFNCLGAFGFGLLLAGCYALRGGATWPLGLLWGLAGFASFSAAPALGLPPELPGAAAADLSARQLWWVATALGTPAGLACLFLTRPIGMRVLGLLLIGAPHLVGAPHSSELQSAIPEALSRSFSIGSLAVSAVMWLILGAVTAALAPHDPAGHG